MNAKTLFKLSLFLVAIWDYGSHKQFEISWDDCYFITVSKWRIHLIAPMFLISLSKNGSYYLKWDCY